MNKYILEIEKLFKKFPKNSVDRLLEAEFWDIIKRFEAESTVIERKKMNEIQRDSLPYYRTNLYYQGDRLQLELRQTKIKIILDMFRNELSTMSASQFFPKYEEIKADILKDMDENPAKYSTTSGDIEW